MPSSKLPTKPATLPMTGPRGLTTHRWCMYKPEVKCARYLACSWKRGGWACISSFSLYEFSNMGPLCTPPLRGRPWAHTDPRLTTNARKTLRQKPRPTQSFARLSVRYSFTQKNRWSHPPTQPMRWDAPIYRPELAPHWRPTHSPGPPLLTPQHQHPLVASKFLNVRNQRAIPPIHPDYPPTLKVTSRWWLVLDRVMDNQIMSSQLKARWLAWPTHRNLRATSKNSNRYMRLPKLI